MPGRERRQLRGEHRRFRKGLWFELLPYPAFDADAPDLRKVGRSRAKAEAVQDMRRLAGRRQHHIEASCRAAGLGDGSGDQDRQQKSQGDGFHMTTPFGRYFVL